MTGDPVLRGEHVVLRPATVDDAARFAEIVCEPGVREWWPCWDEKRFRDALDPAVEGCDHEPWFAIEFEGEVVGIMDYAEETDPGYRSAGLDITIADAWQGRGLGRDALRTLARYLIEQRGHHRLTIDPAVGNERAIHVYRSLGFRPVGVMRRYERTEQGWRDGLLMDLMAEELT